LVLGAFRAAGLRPGKAGHHLLGATQVLLVDDPWLPVHPGGLHKVVVRLVPTLLAHNRRHIWVIHYLTSNVEYRHAYLPMSPTVFGQRRDQPGRLQSNSQETPARAWIGNRPSC